MREWLETNGTGAFAMGTVAGVNTRRYHALLVASLKPPVERYVVLSRFEEEVVAGDRTFALGCCQYPGKLVDEGSRYVEEFLAEPCSTWRYNLGGITFERQVYLVPARQAVVVRYRSDHPLTLRIRPFLAYRDYHSLRHADDSPYAGLPPLEFRPKANFAADPKWYFNIEYLAELDRGLDFREDLFTPGVLTIELQPGEWVPVCASLDGTEPAQPPKSKRDPFLVRRADGKPTVIAGYPWFTDWGRDTMISLPGLLIAPGLLDQAREIIEGYLQFANQGMIPNRFPDAGDTPEYNTADATLWMFQAVRAWVQAGGDRAFLRDVFYPAAKEIITWHQRGTRFDIAVDPEDHLLSAGAQLTWMDTRFTPRQGKPVEINALWHGALSLMAEWAQDLNDPAAGEYQAEAGRVRDNFRARFWNPQRQCLYDVLTPEGPVAQLRPNQLFAVSLPFGLLEPERARAVVRVVERELLTPVGLRTLAPDDPDYQPRYQGSPLERDGAYHQGTVWPWLLGPFIDSYLTAFGTTAENLAYCRRLVETLEAEAARDGCVGSIAEIYDAEEPRYPRGCPAQAWSVAEIARVKAQYF
ncbi:MAG TPA: amylo-alpha-1,6-glucosidase [Bryobacteraceae bacterium]|nr:amylo-alpha-1,6-glucosidase [Bryobacteraceae bacterium]